MSSFVRHFPRFVTMNPFGVGLCCRTALILRRRSSAALPSGVGRVVRPPDYSLFHEGK